VILDAHCGFGLVGNEPFEDMVLRDVAAGMDAHGYWTARLHQALYILDSAGSNDMGSALFIYSCHISISSEYQTKCTVRAIMKYSQRSTGRNLGVINRMIIGLHCL
jgi:hypothetical protein